METSNAEALSYAGEVRPEAANPVPQSANVPVSVVRNEDVPVVVVNSD